MTRVILSTTTGATVLPEAELVHSGSEPFGWWSIKWDGGTSEHYYESRGGWQAEVIAPKRELPTHDGAIVLNRGDFFQLTPDGWWDCAEDIYAIPDGTDWVELVPKGSTFTAKEVADRMRERFTELSQSTNTTGSESVADWIERELSA